uniref:Uncharacterized protein n=1 Tax=Hyaloperonospora arabidopsidis (strain Emoy2) TaxID=559515 RepID=M4BRX6_HYAAE
MVAAIGIDINTFTPAIVLLSVSVVIAPKVNIAYDHGVKLAHSCVPVKQLQPNAPGRPLYRYRSFRVVHCSTGTEPAQFGMGEAKKC